jgi:IgGFc binding protein/Bacterial Ig domain/Bacterial Ig-like domain (group 1)
MTNQKKASQWRLPGTLAMVVCLAMMAMLGQAPPAAALIGVVVPANEFEEPTEEFTTANALFAWVTVDPFGGRVCVVPPDTVDDGNLSCERNAVPWASPNFVTGLGSQLIPIKGPSLKVGTWKLLGDSSKGAQDQLSGDFYVSPCSDCDTSIAQAVIDKWKAAAGKSNEGLGPVCTLTGLYSKTKKALGWVRVATSKAPLRAFTASVSKSALGFNILDPFSPSAFISLGVGMIKDISCAARQMNQDIIDDPPDPEFHNVVALHPIVSPESSDALVRSLSDELTDVTAYGEAQRISFERYFGAVEAHDQKAAAMQADAIANFGETMVVAMRGLAGDFRSFGDRAAAEPDQPDPVTTPAELQAVTEAYERVRANGFTAAELKQLEDAGLDAAEIAAVKSAFDIDIENAPVNVSYTSVLHEAADKLEEAAEEFNEVSLEAGAVAATIHATIAPPGVADDSLTTAEDTPGIVDVLANDGEPGSLDFVEYTSGAHGIVSCEHAGCTYSPEANFNGNDSFTYTVSNGETQSTAQVTVEVTPVNDPPATGTDVVSLPPGATEIVIDPLETDLPGPPEEAGQTLTITALITPPAHGTAEAISSGADAGKVRYTSAAGYHGVDSFEYTTCDDGTTAGSPDHLCSNGSVYIHISSQPPVAEDDAFTVTEDTPTALHPLANDLDPDGDALTLKNAGSTVHGELSCGASQCMYSPEDDFTGPDEFVYEIEAGDESDAGRATIEVTPVNDPPSPVADRLVVPPGTGATVNVLANDADIDGGALSVTGTGAAAHGQATCASDGECEYTPAAGYSGTDTFTYTVSDGAGGTSQGHVSVIVMLTTPTSGAPDNKGTDFWVAFLPNYEGPPELSLFITGDKSTSGKVKIPSLSFSKDFTVAPGNVTTVELPSEASEVGIQDGIGDKGIHVTAADEVSVYGLNRIPFTTDAFLGLPTDILGTDYVVPSWGFGLGTEIGVLATEDGTTITVTPSAELAGRPAGQPYDVDLDAGEMYQLAPSTSGEADLTGTEVSANKPVAVYGGNRCANIPISGEPACDHIVEEIPPTSTWGKSFVTMPLATRLNGDTFRILASTDGTHLSINGSQVATLDRGQFHEQLIDGPATITADQPVLVVQYSNGSGFDGVPSDPFMLIVPPYEQFLSSYTVTTPAEGFELNFINIVVAAGGRESVRLDGVPVPAEEFTAIGSSGFFGAQLPVELGTHLLEGTRPFGSFVYGFNSYDSYGYTGGLSLSPVAEVTQVVVSPETSTRLIGAESCVDAMVTDGGGHAIPGIRVDFSVSGANSGVGFATTDISGNAKFCYTGPEAGEDTVTATVGTVSDAGAIAWTAAQPVGRLEVREALLPTADSGRFDLQIDGATLAHSAGDGGTTGERTVSAGNHTIGELAVAPVSLASYTTAISCRSENGTGATIAQSAGAGPLSVAVAENADVVCTIGNTRKAQPAVEPPTPVACPAAAVRGSADTDRDGILDACDEDPSLPAFCALQKARARVFLYAKKPKVRLVVRYRTKSPAKVTTTYSAKLGDGSWLQIGKLKQKFASEGMFRLPKTIPADELAKVRGAKQFRVKFSLPGTPQSCAAYYTKLLTQKTKVSNQTVFFQTDSKLAGF